MSGTSTGSPGRNAVRQTKRSRIRQACNRCRERKSKCNDLRPCAACIAADAICEDWRPGLSSSTSAPPGASHSLSLEDSAANHLLDMFSSPAAGIASSSNINTLPQSRNQDGPIDFNMTTYTSNVEWPRQPQADRLLRLAFPFDSIYKNERGLLKALSMSSGLGALSYLPEHQKHVSKEVQELLSFFVGTPTNPSAPPDVSIPPSPQPDVPIGDTLWTMMTERVDMSTVWALFRHFQQTAYLFWPTFLMKEFITTIRDEETRCQPDRMCLLLSTCALASRESGAALRTSEPPDTGLFDLYWEIRRLRPSTDWSSLSSIQSLFYLSMYCFGGSGPNGVAMGHTLMNEAISRAFDIGLHRSIEVFSQNFSPAEIEVRNRTLWALYCGDKISAAYGRPVMLRLSDIDVEEINTSDSQLSERSDPNEPSFLVYHRACIRLHMVLERILRKINIPSCTLSPVLNHISSSSRRFNEMVIHQENCGANHLPLDFDEEMSMLQQYRYEGIPPASMNVEDDNMFSCQVERLRSMAAFAKVFVFRHLIAVLNSDIGVQTPSKKYFPELLMWCQDFLASQRKILQRGQFTDFGGTCSYQISQVGRALLPSIYLSNLTVNNVPGSTDNTSPDQFLSALRLSVKLLRDLSVRFPSSLRSLEILETAAKRLDIHPQFEDDSSLPGPSAGILGTGGKRSRWISDLPLSNPLGMTFNMFGTSSLVQRGDEIGSPYEVPSGDSLSGFPGQIGIGDCAQNEPVRRSPDHPLGGLVRESDTQPFIPP